MNLSTAIVAFTQDPTEAHFHQCGRITDGLVEGYGCNHVWMHKAVSPVKTGRVSVADHMCPECGAGPWYYVLSVEELESAHCSV